MEKITVRTDTRDILAHAKRDAVRRKFDDWLIFDMDSHHQESVSWNEIVQFIEDPVVREQAMNYHNERVGAPPYGLNANFGMRYQDVGGRILHQADRREDVSGETVHRDVVLARRAMEAMSVDYTILFPVSMLLLGTHPQAHMEVQLGDAYNRWLTEYLIPQDSRLKTLIYLPFNSPDAAYRTAEKFADKPGVIGFCVTSIRHAGVHENAYMPLYRLIEETGKPIAFHAAYHWTDPSLKTIPTFLGMHSLSFVWCNMVHMTNWILQGIPERFPALKSIWVESGLAWIPFLMQRLDDQYMMRQSEAPLLKRMPSDYMRENCWYSSQPMERGNLEALELTMKMINAETQLLYSSDWPHFDFDTPGSIFNLPFVSEQAKRNILGLNAARLFGLPETRPEP
nr:amidohydrolase family protein [Pseudoruegeria sp. HB172150]